MNSFTDLDVNLNNIMKTESGLAVWPCPTCSALNERPQYRGLRADHFNIRSERGTLIVGSSIECCICGNLYIAPIDFGDE